jgi:hypothetical protein
LSKGVKVNEKIQAVGSAIERAQVVLGSLRLSLLASRKKLRQLRGETKILLDTISAGQKQEASLEAEIAQLNLILKELQGDNNEKTQD